MSDRWVDAKVLLHRSTTKLHLVDDLLRVRQNLYSLGGYEEMIHSVTCLIAEFIKELIQEMGTINEVCNPSNLP